MWIRSQDKKTLVNVSKIYINKVFKNVSIIGETENSTSFATTLGEYESIEMANIELDSIQNFISLNKSNVYEIK